MPKAVPQKIFQDKFITLI